MKQVRLPGTDLTVSRLGFGTASLHHLIRWKDRADLLACALDSGFSHFDTARMYGDGLAEATLGRFLAGGLRQQVTLATKIGFASDPLGEMIPAVMYFKRAAGIIARKTGFSLQTDRARKLSADDAERTLARSLRALRTDWVDVLFVHEPQPDELGALQNLAKWLLLQKSSGRTRLLGLSGAANDCLAIVKEVGGVFDVLQVEDSVAGREADALRAIEWPMQITYGYFRRANDMSDAQATLKAAMARNAQGMVLMSSRKSERLRAAARQAGQEESP